MLSAALGVISAVKKHPNGTDRKVILALHLRAKLLKYFFSVVAKKRGNNKAAVGEASEAHCGPACGRSCRSLGRDNTLKLN